MEKEERATEKSDIIEVEQMCWEGRLLIEANKVVKIGSWNLWGPNNSDVIVGTILGKSTAGWIRLNWKI